jgi:hypothetical protein
MSRSSASPPWAMRIAPAVNAELPPDHSASVFSRTQHARAALAGGVRGGHAGVAGDDDDDVVTLLVHAPRHSRMRSTAAGSVAAA